MSSAGTRARASVPAASVVAGATIDTSTSTDEFFEQRCRFPIHLHPSRLRNVREGVEEQLNALLITYVDELDGVLISYSDLQLTTSPATNPFAAGFIFQERSYIHFDVTARCVVWRVKPHQTLVGVVNAVAADHINLLVHGIFNATLPLGSAAMRPKTLEWQTDRERWIDRAQYGGEEAEAAAEAAKSNGNSGGGDDDDQDLKDGSDAEAAATPAKKLTKKELKKLERKKLRAVMLAATGRAGGAAGASGDDLPTAPVAGIVARGSHIRFELLHVAHATDVVKLTGTLVASETLRKSQPNVQLGLTGVFTPLPKVDTVGANAGVGGFKRESDEHQVDMSAIAAVTHDGTARKKTPAAPSIRAQKSAVSPAQKSVAAPSAAPAVAVSAAKVSTPATSAVPAPQKALTDKQQEKVERTKAKLAQRMAAKGVTDGVAESGKSVPAQTATVDTAPAKKKKSPAVTATPAPVATPAVTKEKKRKERDGEKDDSAESSKKHKKKK